MAGLNLAARLKQQGVQLKKADAHRVALASLNVVTEGPTAHPRAHLPVDESLKDHVKQHGIPTSGRRFKARENGALLDVIDGCRRRAAGLVAERELQKEAPRVWPLEGPYTSDSDPGRLYVEVEVVTCSDLDLILERIGSNVDRGLPDTVDVLAHQVAQIIAINRGEPDAALVSRIMEVVPRYVQPNDIIALSRWNDLQPDLQTRFVSGEAPLQLLGAVLDARRDERGALLDRLLAKGIKSAKGATRTVNAEKRATGERGLVLSRKRAEKLADKLDALPQTTMKPVCVGKTAPVEVQAAAAWIAVGLRLHAAQDVRPLLAQLPKPLSEAIEHIIQEAQAAVRGGK